MHIKQDAVMESGMDVDMDVDMPSIFAFGGILKSYILASRWTHVTIEVCKCV